MTKNRRSKPAQYLYNLGLILSQGVYGLLGGDPDESISGATGKAAMQGRWWFKNVQEPFIDSLFFEPGHCRKSIEHDEGGNAIFNWYDGSNPVWKDKN